MSETGHTRNIEHFQQMISSVNGYGAAYDPSNSAIVAAALQAKLTASNAAMDRVITALAPNKVARNSRANKFEGIRRLVTRVVNSFAASGASDEAIEDARGYKRKIDGARAQTLVDDPNTPEDESQGISVAQTSYTQLVEHFDGLIELLDSDGNHNPNETDLQITQLKAYSAELKVENTNVINTTTPLDNAHITRNDVLYADDTGLVDLAALVKKYVKSVYGADSQQYDQISGLEFRRPR